MDQFSIESSHGTIITDEKGNIIEKQIHCKNCDDCIDNIVRFDLKEFEDHYGELFESMNILDLGGWTDNEYFPPDEEFRKNILLSN